MLALSARLQTPVGHYAAQCRPFRPFANILAVVDRPEASMKITAVGILLVGSTIAGLFRICGRSPIRATDKSTEKKAREE